MLMDLKIYLLTWNVVGRPPIEDLKVALGLEEPVDVTNLPDVFALGLQEVSCKPQDIIIDIIFEDPWEVAFKNALCKWDYVKVKQIRLQGMVLLLFAKREHITHLRGIQASYTRTGFRGMWGNKGGVSIRFSAFGCSICIVNCHLAAHDSELEHRIEEYNQIIDKQKFIDPQTENIITHDYTFWIGDLNFRLDDYTAEEIEYLVKKKNLSQLLAKDQLKKVMKLGQAFSEFSETTPTFTPTYKFYVDKHEYDIEKRKPAWTDRILFRLTPNAYENITLSLKQHYYRSHIQYTQSDHKPVSSSFTLKVFSNSPEKRVKFLPISQWKVNEDSVAWYTFSDGASPNTWDWIGLYRANFTSTDEHVCYVWAPVRPSRSTPDLMTRSQSSSNAQFDDVEETASGSDQHQNPWYRVVFADQTLLVPGQYKLFYISSEFDDILGISEQFELIHDDDGVGGGDLEVMVAVFLMVIAVLMMIV